MSASPQETPSRFSSSHSGLSSLRPNRSQNNSNNSEFERRRLQDDIKTGFNNLQPSDLNSSSEEEDNSVNIAQPQYHSSTRQQYLHSASGSDTSTATAPIPPKQQRNSFRPKSALETAGPTLESSPTLLADFNGVAQRMTSKSHSHLNFQSSPFIGSATIHTQQRTFGSNVSNLVNSRKGPIHSSPAQLKKVYSPPFASTSARPKAPKIYEDEGNETTERVIRVDPRLGGEPIARKQYSEEIEEESSSESEGGDCRLPGNMTSLTNKIRSRDGENRVYPKAPPYDEALLRAGFESANNSIHSHEKSMHVEATLPRDIPLFINNDSTEERLKNCERNQSIAERKRVEHEARTMRYVDEQVRVAEENQARQEAAANTISLLQKRVYELETLSAGYDASAQQSILQELAPLRSRIKEIGEEMNLIRNSVAQLGSEQHALMQRELETRAAIKVIGEERKRAGVEEIRLENEHVAGVSYRRTVSPISLTRENLAAQDSEATPRAKAHLKAPSSSSSHSSRMSNALQQARQAAIDAKSDHASEHNGTPILRNSTTRINSPKLSSPLNPTPIRAPHSRTTSRSYPSPLIQNSTSSPKAVETTQEIRLRKAGEAARAVKLADPAPPAVDMPRSASMAKSPQEMNKDLKDLKNNFERSEREKAEMAKRLGENRGREGVTSVIEELTEEGNETRGDLRGKVVSQFDENTFGRVRNGTVEPREIYRELHDAVTLAWDEYVLVGASLAAAMNIMLSTDPLREDLEVDHSNATEDATRLIASYVQIKFKLRKSFAVAQNYYNNMSPRAERFRREEGII